MSDRYSALANSALGGMVTRRLGLPVPPTLERHSPGKPVVSGPVLIGGARNGRLQDAVLETLRSIGAHAATEPPTEGEDGGAFSALVFDASGIEESGRLQALYEFFHPVIRRLQPNGRLIVLGSPPDEGEAASSVVAQRALEGFTRSAAKEIGGRGSTAQLVQVAAGAEGELESTLRFLLSARSAYVSGQVIRIEAVEPEALRIPDDWDEPLAGRSAVVTGAARGIGEAIATVLARDGAEVVCVDVPAAGEAVSGVANRIGGEALQLDITDPQAGARLGDYVAERHEGLDVLVHNAGITRDKTIGRMRPEQWDSVIAVNLTSQERITGELLDRELLGSGSSVISVSSVSGIAGNRGQANYATSKAGVIGTVIALAPVVRERGGTINAVAPGFIETAMTEAMPVAAREVGRRANSLVQGGQPVDVAETVAWLASPASGGVNGNVVRVCGQALIGA